ncbi:unnamed protein product, partial [Rangifer tarandus platyrhynchus]
MDRDLWQDHLWATPVPPGPSWRLLGNSYVRGLGAWSPRARVSPGAAAGVRARRCSGEPTEVVVPVHFCQAHGTCLALGSVLHELASRKSKELASNLRRGRGDARNLIPASQILEPSDMSRIRSKPNVDLKALRGPDFPLLSSSPVLFMFQCYPATE